MAENELQHPAWDQIEQAAITTHMQHHRGVIPPSNIVELSRAISQRRIADALDRLIDDKGAICAWIKSGDTI